MAAGRRLLTWLHRLEDWLLLVLLLGVLGLAVTQIVLRNVADSGISWADPVIRVAVFWLGILGAMVATRERKHIRVDVMLRLLSGWPRRVVGAICRLFAGLTCAALAWHSGRLVGFEIADPTDSLLGVPLWLLQAVMPVGFGLMAIRFCVQAIVDIRGRPLT